MAEFQMDQDAFHKHMKSKIEHWGPVALNLGDDFCVMRFNYKYQCENAIESCSVWKDSYNYSTHWNGDNKLCIINKTHFLD